MNFLTVNNMYEVKNYKSPTRSFTTENPNDVLREFKRFLPPTKTYTQLKTMLEQGIVVKFSDIAEAKKI